MPSDGSVFLFLRLLPWLHLCSRLPGDAVPVGSFFFRFLFIYLLFAFLFLLGFMMYSFFPFPWEVEIEASGKYRHPAGYF